MKYYKVVFEEIPYIRFAHSYETEKYQYAFGSHPDACEITYIERGDVLWRYTSGEESTTRAPCVNFLPFLKEGTGSSAQHKHYTFCISSRMNIYEINTEEILNCSRAFLQEDSPEVFFAVIPGIVTDKKCIETIAEKIRLIITRRSEKKPSGNMACTATAIEICRILTDYSFKQVLSSGASLPYSEICYCEKAVTYMCAHFLENISVAKVSEEVGISVGYLSRIFKKNIGKSIIQYINSLKINYAMTLFETKKLPVAEAAWQVGITDEKYFCRLFKKQTGMTPGKYKDLKFIRY